eukprot:CAMPEP_0117677296 /NCGR_PEP_ID=MMETSP0804-20121206/16670_1 /TAXON_ID=1074897 /ORGANISM="Tetraselmis astigmatica, Strain CCMP880" /LENGTH=230 /DNA_ID=CAMNT_0005486571 /DNA_START=46 /DNA_END=735 /DNA_ORIENTATION=+
MCGQWALVTGGGRGVGKAIALALAKKGFSVALTSRSQEQLDKVAGACKEAGAPEVLVLPCDLCSAAAVDEMADQFLAKAGSGVEVLVNNAGSLASGSPLEGEPDEWDRMMALNLSTPMRLTRRLTPTMAANMKGYVINIGSIAAIEPMSGTSAAYAAAKHGLRGWSISSYLTLRHKNIKCMLINPAFVNTELVANVPNTIPERMIQPSDIAAAVDFVLSSSGGCVPEEIN